MNIQLPADLDAAIQSFIVSGQYPNEEAVLREALAVLGKREHDLQAIEEGVADMQARRVRPWAEVKTTLEAKHGFKSGDH